MRQSRYWKAGVTVFLTVAAILLFYDVLFGHRSAVLLLSRLISALEPILYGAMIAYLLAPMVDFFDRHIAPRRAAFQGGRFRAAWVRAASLAATWAVIAVFGYLLMSFLVPEVYRSILRLAGNMETYYNTILQWTTALLEQNPSLETWVMDQMNAYYADLSKLVTDQLLPQAQQLMTAVGGGVLTALSFLKNLLVGVIVSVYLLATKERCAAYCRKLTCAALAPAKAGWVFRAAGTADRIFSGFVRGKLLDSLIIGILCFFFSTIFKFPYAPLVSVIVGVTNVIPFFGPFLGAIPSLFLILLDSPIKALYFLVFIFALQQVDGNIIGPKILGGRTGLSSLWVIIAILVGGSFFGVAGMFFAVPVFACFNTFMDFWMNCRLKKRGMPAEVSAYWEGAPRPKRDLSGEKED
ncbi:AI-2E family transporter [uncultured Oscillibacter sp.]|uniref:AI-2E family transporter n=1 Tax=uncultured Oscillibacter sp. TaxID=876091 RepID=UPI0025EBE22F|nr:AI-2E family transporter [uncultured Oscillibacter sp.]